MLAARTLEDSHAAPKTIRLNLYVDTLLSKPLMHAGKSLYIICRGTLGIVYNGAKVFFMCVCMHTCMQHTCMYACMSVCMDVHTYCMYGCAYICMDVHTYVWT